MQTRIIWLLLLACGLSAKPPPTQVGTASWYGERYHGRQTASGETFDTHQLTAAHRTLPFGSRVRVTDTRTGRSVTVRINDRGPFVEDRLLDLSHAAARELGMLRSGLAQVRIERLSESRGSEAVGGASTADPAERLSSESFQAEPSRQASLPAASNWRVPGLAAGVRVRLPSGSLCADHQSIERSQPSGRLRLEEKSFLSRFATICNRVRNGKWLDGAGIGPGLRRQEKIFG